MGSGTAELEVDGHITASGNISSSGTLTGAGLNVVGTSNLDAMDIDGNVQLDGSGTYPDENADLSVPGLVAWFENQMNWYLSDNLDSVIATGVRPIVNLDCIMSDDDNLCIGNHTIVLKIELNLLGKETIKNILKKQLNLNLSHSPCKNDTNKSQH